MESISSAAINALTEALTNIYWYKNDLRSFLFHTISNPDLLSKLNWGDYKRNIASNLVNHLAQNQQKYKDDLLNLMNEVCKMEDFSHLERLEDGKAKLKTAKQSVNALKKIYGTHQNLVKDKNEVEKRKKQAQQRVLNNQNFKEKLNNIKEEFYKLSMSSDPQKRGYSLETVLKELFNLFDLDPKASFRNTGEQIDGGFTFQNNDYLFEAKWQQKPVNSKELDSFEMKLKRKLDNTLGLFLAINGFSKDAITIHSGRRSLMILMDSSDIVAVLDQRIDLVELLLRKRKHAAQTGEIYYTVNEIFGGK